MKTVSSLFVLLYLTAVAIAAPPTIKLVGEAKGAKGDFIPIVVETEGKEVKFHPLSKELRVFPPAFLNPNIKGTVVSSLTEGTFDLLAYTAKGDELSNPVVIKVTVGSGGVDPKPKPNPDPDPNPNPDNPILKDPLYTPVLQAYKGLTDSEKGNKVKLSEIYKAVSDQVGSTNTSAQLFGVINQATNDVIGQDNMRPVRALFGAELAKFLPSAAGQQLTAEQKGEAAKQLLRFSSILEAIK